MAEQQIRFEDGAAYERMMGAWSRLAGNIFLDWLAPRPGLRWIDIGCGRAHHLPGPRQRGEGSPAGLIVRRSRATSRS